MLDLRDSGKPDNGKRYDDATKELAYQLWAFVCQRRPAEVARLLATEEYGNLEVSNDTVSYWAREYTWPDRASRELHAIAPDIRGQTFGELLLGGLDGAKYIRQVAGGAVAGEKVRLMASIAAVDRIGFSPVGKGTPAIDAPQPTESKTYSVQELMRMSPDQLMQLEEEARRKR